MIPPLLGRPVRALAAVLVTLVALVVANAHARGQGGLALRALPPGAHVVDAAGLLGAETASVESAIASLEAASGARLACLTLRSGAGEDPKSIAVRAVNAWSLGRRSVLLLVVLEPRRLYLQPGDDLASVFDGDASSAICRDRVAPLLKQGRSADAIRAGFGAVSERLGAPDAPAAVRTASVGTASVGSTATAAPVSPLHAPVDELPWPFTLLMLSCAAVVTLLTPLLGVLFLAAPVRIYRRWSARASACPACWGGLSVPDSRLDAICPTCQRAFPKPSGGSWLITVTALLHVASGTTAGWLAGSGERGAVWIAVGCGAFAGCVVLASRAIGWLERPRCARCGGAVPRKRCRLVAASDPAKDPARSDPAKKDAEVTTECPRCGLATDTCETVAWASKIPPVAPRAPGTGGSANDDDGSPGWTFDSGPSSWNSDAGGSSGGSSSSGAGGGGSDW